MHSSLKGKFIEATTQFQQSPHSEGCASVIYRTPWVRILIEPHKEDDTYCIEVEVFLSDQDGVDESDSMVLFDRLVRHVDYLRCLREHGFELCIIGSGCILCATKVIEGTPQDNLFSALLPP
ncbi:MAG: hypothetical protein ACFFDR_12975 [Candidatus Thorarchaeota archaeon]